MSEAATVVIRAIAGGGDGVGSLADGRTVFVPRTAPGDRVTISSVRRHASFARARVARVVEPGPGRVTPPCPHYVVDHCGGCQLMHLDIATQREVKSRVVGDAIRRIGKVELTDPEVMPAPIELGYRAKVTFAVRGSTIGFHRLGEAGDVFDVRRCLLIDAALDDLHQRIRALRSLLPPDCEQVVLRLDATGAKHLIVRTVGSAWQAPSTLGNRLGSDVVLWWHPADGAARAVHGANTPWPAAVFEQVNPSVGRSVREYAVGRLLHDAPPEAMVWDLYSGIGETTVLLAAAGCRVESVELDPRAVAHAEELGPTGPRRLAGDVAHRLVRLSAPDLIVTNPPRAGMDEAVTDGLRSSGAQKIAYVSCDPATLARDLRRLSTSYRVASLKAFDQFPQTAHVESVAILERQ
jgi:23S rRNA (uracil1939-C5)-methyltransferase